MPRGLETKTILETGVISANQTRAATSSTFSLRTAWILRQLRRSAAAMAYGVFMPRHASEKMLMNRVYVVRPSRPGPAWIFWVNLALAGCAGPGTAGSPQSLERCEPAERYVINRLGMIAETGPDTLDDWRTDRVLYGCRVTAAGATSLELRDVAEGFYAGLFAEGWQRTPDPQDAPAESSLRLRQGETDCLFSLYDNIVIGTPAELRVSNALAIAPGEKRYNLLAQCFRAMDSAG